MTRNLTLTPDAARRLTRALANVERRPVNKLPRMTRPFRGMEEGGSGSSGGGSSSAGICGDCGPRTAVGLAEDETSGLKLSQVVVTHDLDILFGISGMEMEIVPDGGTVYESPPIAFTCPEDPPEEDDDEGGEE